MTEEVTAHVVPPRAADLALEVILEKKGRDILILDISECSDLGDTMIIATATNMRQVQAVAKEMDIRLRAAGYWRLTVAGMDTGAWVVLDFGDLLVHVMQEAPRRYYDLEALWADARVVQRVEGAPRGSVDELPSPWSPPEDHEVDPLLSAGDGDLDELVGDDDDGEEATDAEHLPVGLDEDDDEPMESDDGSGREPDAE